jgi:ABC-type multidrug transport system fused ATPase/permease subunit
MCMHVYAIIILITINITIIMIIIMLLIIVIVIIIIIIIIITTTTITIITRFLIVDEADRIVEEGHFPELHKMFSRIRNHEKLVENGENPITAAKKLKDGTHEKNSELPRKINKNSTHKNIKKESTLAIKNEKIDNDDNIKTVVTDDAEGGDISVQGKKKKVDTLFFFILISCLL